MCSIHRAVAFTILREQSAILLCHSAWCLQDLHTATVTLQSEVMILSACDKETDASNITTCPDISLSLSLSLSPSDAILSCRAECGFLLAGGEGMPCGLNPHRDTCNMSNTGRPEKSCEINVQTFRITTDRQYTTISVLFKSVEPF